MIFFYFFFFKLFFVHFLFRCCSSKERISVKNLSFGKSYYCEIRKVSYKGQIKKSNSMRAERKKDREKKGSGSIELVNLKRVS